MLYYTPHALLESAQAMTSFLEAAHAALSVTAALRLTMLKQKRPTALPHQLMRTGQAPTVVEYLAYVIEPPWTQHHNHLTHHMRVLSYSTWYDIENL